MLDRARACAADSNVDLLLSIGGGSTTGTAEAVALNSNLPIVAVPTTYAGSEMTPVWGLTTSGKKQTGRSDAVLPKAVIYDPELVETLPPELAVASAFNALAHCVESLWTPTANPITSRIALERVRAIAAGLREMDADPSSGVDSLLYGAYTWRARPSPWRARACITRSVTFWAGRSTCRTHRPTRLCCPKC